ncbi:MAG: pantoate--beta-alanine ligase [Candidatus Omnitrophota bacterium]
MKIIRNIKEMSEVAKKHRQRRKSIGLVPTMGALHEGHLSLVRQARRENVFVVVSIFVNPAQFGAKEDLKSYPEPFKNDLVSCRKEGVDIIFHPEAKQIYPEGYKTYVEVKNLSDLLCGKPRPGHFIGVATIVTKFFNIVQPDTAYFGQKDAQQAVIIKKMVKDLNIPVEIKVMPIVRQKDGLAMSSRNTYLSAQGKKDALVLSQSLNLAKDLIQKGLRDSHKIIHSMNNLIKNKKAAKIEYIAIVDSKNLKPIEIIKNHCLIALAVKIGKARLIDNYLVT